MLLRNQPSPILCLLLAIGLAGPTSIVPARSSSGLDGSTRFGPGRAATGIASSPRVVAAPLAPADDRGSLVVACRDFDDAEESDGQPVAKRPASALLAPTWAGPGTAIAGAGRPIREPWPRPTPARTRPGSLRC